MRGQLVPAVTQFSSFLYSCGGDCQDGVIAAYETYGKLLRDAAPTRDVGAAPHYSGRGVRMSNTTRTTERTTSPSEGLSRWANSHLRDLFILPSVIYIAVMIIFPILHTVFLSFANARGSVSRPSSFIGFEDYTGRLTDIDRFWSAAGRAVYYTGFALAIELAWGMASALLLGKSFRGVGDSTCRNPATFGGHQR